MPVKDKVTKPNTIKFRNALLIAVSIIMVLAISLFFSRYPESENQMSCETSRPEGNFLIGIYGHTIDLTSDGGFIVAGYIKYLSKQKKDHDVWVMKADKNGDPEWRKTFGGARTDRAWSVKETRDGDYLIAGESYSFGNNYQAMLLKLDPSGSQQWLKLVGGNHAERGMDIYLSTDDRIFVTGVAHSDSLKRPNFLLCQTSLDGNILVQRSFDHELAGGGVSISMLQNGDLVLLGNLQNAEDHSMDFGLLRLDRDGIVQSQKRFGSIQSDEAKVIVADRDGGYMVAGTEYKDKQNKSDVVVYKFDEFDEIQWKSYLGGQSADGGENLILTSDGGYAVVGYTQSFGAGLRDVYIVKLSPSGQEEWTQTFGGKSTDWGYDLKQTEDDGFMISAGSKSTGQNATDIWIIKLDKNGLKVWDRVYE